MIPSSPQPEPRIPNPAPSVQVANEPQAPSLKISDIYYTLFRHKWKILLCSIAGVAAAFALYRMSPPPYQSEAKLFIRYVITEGNPPAPGRDDTTTKSPDQRGETIIRSELEILTSMDLANDVVKSVSAARILGDAKIEGDATNAAATLVNRNLSIEVPPNSSVIRVSFVHPDPRLVQDTLREIVGSYLKKHVEIHRAMGIVGDYLTQETDQLRARLAETEEELRKAMHQAGVISLEDSKKSYAEQISRLRQQIFDSQTELAQRISVLSQMRKAEPSSTAPMQTQEETAKAASLTQEQLESYNNINAQLAPLRLREQELLASYTEQSSMVQEVRSQRLALEERKRNLEAEYPTLGASTSTGSERPAANLYNPVMEAAQIVALESKIKTLSAQLDEVRRESAKVDQLETSILELRRRKELEESNYRYYAARLEQSRINEALGSGRVSNISLIESPTPPKQNWGKKIKLLGGLCFGGVAAGLAWALLIELFMDRSIRRPADVARWLQLPLFLSIPKVSKMADANEAKRALPASSDSKAPHPTPATSEQGESLSPFHETLRDRLISYFDSLDVRHKPKLVAVTGIGKNTGITTVAAGLARSFSEAGEGNVLLIDMTKGQGSVQHFRHGSNIVGLEQLLQTRSSAKVDDNLFVVTENPNSERLAKGMPQRFNQLIPKLKASDFEYIIFDMPPVSQISITPRLASFMDMMLVVVEAEKTDRDAAESACSMLAGSKASVGVVLNKTKSYVPAALQRDTIDNI